MARPGDTIGPYVIESLIAEGGMGAVYRAKNRVTGQLRALKVIRASLAEDPDFVDRFVREATIASQVRHRFLVETLEPGIDGDTIYLPMELLEGETLHARFRRLKRMPPADVAKILGPVCEAVQALHDRRLVHRDLKPLNVFLARTPESDEETPKVLDLGTARSIGDDEQTATGAVVGSPHYMAPEQADGRRDIDGRVDQYAMGVIAYQLLTGHRPYESDDTRSALAKLLRGEPVRPPRELNAALPAELESVVLRALSHAREARFDRIADLGAALVASAGAAPGMAERQAHASAAAELPTPTPTPAPALTPTPTPAPTPAPAVADVALDAPVAPRRWPLAVALAVLALVLVAFAWRMSVVSGPAVDAAPPTSLVALPPSVIVPPPPTALAAPSPSEPEAETPPPSEATTTVTSVAPETPPPPTTRATGRRGTRRGADDEPACGLSTGIPCID